MHCAFDLIELDGEVLRLISIETRKRTLASLLRGTHSSIVLNQHFEGGVVSVALSLYPLAQPRTERRAERHPPTCTRGRRRLPLKS